jgi:hypothetical protein
MDNHAGVPESVLIPFRIAKQVPSFERRCRWTEEELWSHGVADLSTGLGRRM